MIHPLPQTLTHPVEWFVSLNGHSRQLLLSAMWGKPLPVAGTLNDNLVAGIGQTVKGTIAQDGIIKVGRSESRSCGRIETQGRFS